MWPILAKNIRHLANRPVAYVYDQEMRPQQALAILDLVRFRVSPAYYDIVLTRAKHLLRQNSFDDHISYVWVVHRHPLQIGLFLPFHPANLCITPTQYKGLVQIVKKQFSTVPVAINWIIA